MMLGEEVIGEQTGVKEGSATLRPTSRSKKSQKKREAIVAAATGIINARTYALATMSEIAASLDLRDATLYYYFPSKQALVYACHCRSLERTENYLLAAHELEGNGADKLEHFLRLLLDDSHRNGPLLYFGDYFHLEAQQRQTIGVWAARLTGMLEDMLKRGIADGSIAPCETGLVVNLLLGMLIWLAKWTNTIEDLTVDRLMTAIQTLSFNGLDQR